MNEKCDNCGNDNKELVVLKGLLFGKYYLCQKCVSKSFRSFNKDK